MAAFLEDYTMLDEIGSGGYATVYKVRHNQLDYIRAIRVLDKTITSTKDKLYLNFLEECKLLLRLGNGNHPNIVHIYQPLLKANKALVEMDFIDGQDLTHYIKKKQFVEIEEVLLFVKEMSSALAYCHHDIYKVCYDKERDHLADDPEEGTKPYIDDVVEKRLVEKYRVIHNDIHSGNIMRRENGHYVLLDFGLAIEGSDVIRSSKRRNGAPEYKSPEKWDNEDVISTESDIYSFGIVLYEFLTGRVPFPFNQKISTHIAEHELYLAHKMQNPPSIFDERKKAYESTHSNKNYQKDYPDWLESLILKCLEKSSKKRFKNGKDLCVFIEREKQKKESSQTNLWRLTKTMILDKMRGKDKDPFFDGEDSDKSTLKKENSVSDKKSGDPFFDTPTFKKESNFSNDANRDPFFEGGITHSSSDSKKSRPKSKIMTGDSFFDSPTLNKKEKGKDFFEDNKK